MTSVSRAHESQISLGRVSCGRPEIQEQHGDGPYVVLEASVWVTLSLHVSAQFAAPGGSGLQGSLDMAFFMEGHATVQDRFPGRDGKVLDDAVPRPTPWQLSCLGEQHAPGYPSGLCRP